MPRYSFPIASGIAVFITATHSSSGRPLGFPTAVLRAPLALRNDGRFGLKLSRTLQQYAWQGSEMVPFSMVKHLLLDFNLE